MDRMLRFASKKIDTEKMMRNQITTHGKPSGDPLFELTCNGPIRHLLKSQK